MATPSTAKLSTSLRLRLNLAQTGSLILLCARHAVKIKTVNAFPVTKCVETPPAGRLYIRTADLQVKSAVRAEGRLRWRAL